MTPKVWTALARPEAVAAPMPGRPGRFGVFTSGDRRRRPQAVLTQAQVRAMLSDGAIAQAEGGVYRLTAAGRAMLGRKGAPGEAGSGPLVLEARTVVSEAGALQAAVGVEPAVARLARLKDMGGEAWLTPQELTAARRLSGDLEAGARGDLRTSRWGADAGGGGQVGVRGSAGAEAALMLGQEARKRAAAALQALAPPLRRVAERVCRDGITLEELERQDKWPARSGKVALKLALSQLAVAYQQL